MTKQFHDHALSQDALDQIFREARSYNGWLENQCRTSKFARFTIL